MLLESLRENGFGDLICSRGAREKTRRDFLGAAVLSALCRLPLCWAPAAACGLQLGPICRVAVALHHPLGQARGGGGWGRGQSPRRGLAESRESFPTSDVLAFPASELLLFRY